MNPNIDYEKIDPECRDLVKAMNCFDDIQTVESCCGHGETPFHIWFDALSLDALPPLLWHIDG